VGGVDLFRQTRGPFYRWERAGAEVADGGGPAACNSRCRARWLWERAGEVRSRHLGTVGVLWRAHAPVGNLQRAEGKRGGSGRFPPCLPCLTAGAWAGVTGDR
jgi:hypothetical protein